MGCEPRCAARRGVAVSLVISGRIVPLAQDSELTSSEQDSFRGKVWIGDDGRVERVTRRNASGPKSGGKESTKACSSFSILPPRSPG